MLVHSPALTPRSFSNHSTWSQHVQSKLANLLKRFTPEQLIERTFWPWSTSGVIVHEVTECERPNCVAPRNESSEAAEELTTRVLAFQQVANFLKRSLRLQMSREGQNDSFIHQRR